ncbi:SRPBCC family protein [Peribacillus saganii]|uniref:SRPBCC family protein n=1 Tax=Peribacillus saganii TaxID=2303992 RepID=A0A372LMB7_9BACI|nr:SRPBCC family protein [Peribacillus saganii]RFU67681.1 SRPBCC family protein [Peribacillus saganii]
MPSGVHMIDLPVPARDVWNFICEMENWAPLVPGYISHEILNDRRSTWTFVSDLGIIKKEICMQVEITEWNEPREVLFELIGLNENFTGGGYFKAEIISTQQTKMTGSLDITARGLTAPVANSLLKINIPQTAKELAEAVASKILETKKG